MTPELIRFILNVRDTFGRLSDQQLYQLAVSLAAELHDRHVDVEPEARALCAALLAHAQTEHRAIHSDDCTPEYCIHRVRPAACVVCAPFVAPAAE